MEIKPIAEFGVRWATRSKLLELNEEAISHAWGARFSDLDQLDSVDVHVVIPVLKNGLKPDGIQSYRCYIWYRLQRGDRLCSLMDIAVDSLVNLNRADASQLELLALMLLEQIPLSSI